MQRYKFYFEWLVAFVVKEISFQTIAKLFIYVNNLVNHRQGKLEGAFSIATTPRRRGRHYFFWIAQFTTDPYFIMMSVK